MDLSTLRIMNAAGWCKTLNEVQKLARTPVTEITVGSFTIDERPGNDGSTFWESSNGVYALNSRGLPNMGLKKLLEVLPEMKQLTEAAGKRLRINISGFSSCEYEDLAYAVSPYANVIEINLGCPNVWGSGGQKPIASFNLKLMDKIFACMHPITVNTGVRFAIKVSPYSDPTLLDEVASVLKDHRNYIHEVVACNTFPNAFGWEGEHSAITPGGGFAGMSGKAMKGIALGQAIRFRGTLSWNDFSIVGVGGITTGQDVLDYMRGALNGVQVGTHYFVHGPKVFSELLQECIKEIA